MTVELLQASLAENRARASRQYGRAWSPLSHRPFGLSGRLRRHLRSNFPSGCRPACGGTSVIGPSGCRAACGGTSERADGRVERRVARGAILGAVEACTVNPDCRQTVALDGAERLPVRLDACRGGG